MKQPSAALAPPAAPSPPRAAAPVPPPAAPRPPPTEPASATPMEVDAEDEEAMLAEALRLSRESMDAPPAAKAAKVEAEALSDDEEDSLEAALGSSGAARRRRRHPLE